VRDRELRSFCKKVQTKLALLDWSIDIRSVGREKLNGNVGHCWWDSYGKTATIEVLETKSVKALPERRDDPDCYTRKTVIHELCHVLIEGHLREPSGSPELEVAIIRLENAIVGLWECA
jgi:hypothetical protein